MDGGRWLLIVYRIVRDTTLERDLDVDTTRFVRIESKKIVSFTDRRPLVNRYVERVYEPRARAVLSLARVRVVIIEIGRFTS